MDNLQFIQRLYKGKNCYSDSMTSEQINLLHVPSGVEAIIQKMVLEKRIVFLTGNPGDGKTFIIKALYPDDNDIYIESVDGFVTALFDYMRRGGDIKDLDPKKVYEKALKDE